MNLFRSPFIRVMQHQCRAVAQKGKFKQFSSFFVDMVYPNQKGKAETKKESPEDEAKKTLDIGRSWKADELRLKSNEDLHKLWYVLLKEKNAILADGVIYQKLSGQKMPVSRLNKVNTSMSRLQSVITERKKIRGKYREHLENEYTQQMKEKLQEQHEKEKINQQINPQVSYALLRSKFEELRQGRDNQDYIFRQVSTDQNKQKYKEYLREKYNYGRKKVINPETAAPEQLEQMNKDDYIFAFKNSIEEQLKSNQSRVSQEEVLRAHVRNWKALDLKQRRIVLNYLNIRRSRDAKSAFVKELNLLAQKIAYEEKNLNQAA